MNIDDLEVYLVSSLMKKGADYIFEQIKDNNESYQVDAPYVDKFNMLSHHQQLIYLSAVMKDINDCSKVYDLSNISGKSDVKDNTILVIIHEALASFAEANDYKDEDDPYFNEILDLYQQFIKVFKNSFSDYEHLNDYYKDFTDSEFIEEILIDIFLYDRDFMIPECNLDKLNKCNPDIAKSLGLNEDYRESITYKSPFSEN